MPAVLLVGAPGASVVAALSNRGHDLRLVPHDGVAVEHADDVDCAVVRDGPRDLAVVDTFSEDQPDVPIVYAVGDAGDQRSNRRAAGTVNADGGIERPDEGETANDRSERRRPSDGHVADVEAALERGADDHVSLVGDGAGERLVARVDRLAGPPTPDVTGPLRTDGDRSDVATARSAQSSPETTPDAPSAVSGEFESAVGHEADDGDEFESAVGGEADDGDEFVYESDETLATDTDGQPKTDTDGQPKTDTDDPHETNADDALHLSGTDPSGEETEQILGAEQAGDTDTPRQSEVSERPSGADRESEFTFESSPTATDDDTIRTLLESAGALMDAEDAVTLAETVVRAAEEVLGYDLVAVHLLDGDGTLEPVAVTDRTRAAVGELLAWSIESHPAGEAVREGRPVEIDAEALGEQDGDALDTTFVVPLGDHGTLSFPSTGDGEFDAADRRVAELLAANATVALDRIYRLERLERLHHATQTMLDAGSPRAVAERAIEAAASVLGYDLVTFYLHDEDTDGRGGPVLDPVAWTDERQLALGDPDVVAGGDEARWRAFEEGRVVRETLSLPAEGPFGELRSRLSVPIGDHGVLTVLAERQGAFDETDVQIAQLLATNTARTLDRVERTQELERYQSVFETVSDMVYVLDKKGFITHCTPALARRLGYRRSELLGKHVSQLVDDEALQEIAAIADRLLSEPASAARTQRIDLQTVRGEEIPVQIDVSLLPGEGYQGVVGTIREISDLLAVREQLDSQQARFEYLFENIPDPVVETNHEDGKATAVSVNPAFVDTFGFDADELRDRPLNDVIVPDEHRQEADLLDERLAEGEIHQTEIERETQYGVREFLFRGVPYTAADGARRAFAIYTDITEQRERERHLDVLQRILRHNVRNDLNVLLGGLDKFEKDGLDEATLETLQGSADDLLAMSKKAKRISNVLEAGRDQLDTMDLTTLVRDVVDQYREEEVDIVTDLPPSCPVVGSPTIVRAIEELVGNAVEHAGDDPTIEISVSTQGQRASVTVADDGPGIPEQERLMLQEDEITPVQHGSGLGLWLVKHATTASGGTISFDEPADGGSVTLSFRRAQEQP